MTTEGFAVTMQQVLTELASDRRIIPDLLIEQADAENAVRAAEQRLTLAKRAVEDATVAATARAMFGEGAGAVVDGKNAETRKAQLDVFLLRDVSMNAAMVALARAESELLDARETLEHAQAQARAVLTQASLAQHGANLLASYAHLLTEPAALTPVNTADLYRREKAPVNGANTIW